MRRAPSGCGTAMAALIVLLLVVPVWLWRNENLFPPNSLPWRPVALDAPPGWIAHWQMRSLRDDRALCRAALGTASQLRATPLADRRIDGDCGFDNVMRNDATPVAFSPHVTATCAMTAALYWYQRRLQPVALAQLHSRLVGINQLGTFACRNVNNEAVGNRSEHATANAIDVAGFRLADGRVIPVARDYGKPTPEGRFLDAAHDAACQVFNTVLGPRYNRLHAGHFHLDMGRTGICS
jgi:hypothetical protein